MIDELSATTRQLVAAERIAAWQEVARRLAHEVKNPLTPIRMALETLREARQANRELFETMFEPNVAVMLEEVERLRRIVDEFGSFARLPRPSLSPLDLSALTGQVVGLHATGSGRVQLRSQIVPGVGVNADRDLITQVLLNLIKNAEEASPAGGTITVRVSVSGGEARVEVDDEGPGVPEAVRQRLFEPYATTKPGGTGLGLAIAARICQEHSGRLELDPDWGPGARFRMVLPEAPFNP